MALRIRLTEILQHLLVILPSNQRSPLPWKSCGGAFEEEESQSSKQTSRLLAQSDELQLIFTNWKVLALALFHTANPMLQQSPGRARNHKKNLANLLPACLALTAVSFLRPESLDYKLPQTYAVESDPKPLEKARGVSGRTFYRSFYQIIL